MASVTATHRACGRRRPARRDAGSRNGLGRAAVPRAGADPAAGLPRLSRPSTRSSLSFNRGRARRVHPLGRARQLHRPAPTTRLHRPQPFPPSARSSTTSCGWSSTRAFVIFLGLVIAVVAIAGPLRVADQGDRVPADGDRGDGARRHLDVRLPARPEHRPAERDPRHRPHRTDLVARRPGLRERGADRGRHLGLGRLRDGHPVGGPEGHLVARSSRPPAPTARTSSRSSGGSSCRWSACRSRSSR